MHHVMNSLSTVTLQEIRGYHVQVWIPIQFIRRDNASESGIFGLGREFLDSLWTGGHMVGRLRAGREVTLTTRGAQVDESAQPG
jgi:hypothetical protein